MSVKTSNLIRREITDQHKEEAKEFIARMQKVACKTKLLRGFCFKEYVFTYGVCPMPDVYHAHCILWVGVEPICVPTPPSPELIVGNVYLYETDKKMIPCLVLSSRAEDRARCFPELQATASILNHANRTYVKCIHPASMVAVLAPSDEMCGDGETPRLEVTLIPEHIVNTDWSLPVELSGGSAEDS